MCSHVAILYYMAPYYEAPLLCFSINAHDPQYGVACIMFICDQVMKKAQMIKKGHLRHTWKMRWFVLTSTDLIYYETKESLVKKVCVCARLSLSLCMCNVCMHAHT